MNKHQVIDVAAKIMGIYMAVQAVLSLKNIFWAISLGSAGDTEYIVEMLLSSLFSFTLFAIVAYYLIRKSGKIADKVLAQDEDKENIQLNIDRLFLLDLGIFIIGGVLLSFTVPQFAYSVYTLLFHFAKDSGPYYNWGNLTVEMLQVILGFFAVTNYHRIRRWIVKYQDKNSISVDNQSENNQ